jgi:uncharacterized protein involved in exopolysaccharide biosynthesis
MDTDLSPEQGTTGARAAGDEPITLIDLGIPLLERRNTLVLGSIAAGLIALGITFVIPPTYLARTSIIPPQQQQSSAAAALASLGALAGLAGTAPGMKSPADQYASLMESEGVADRIIDKFKLVDVYDVDFRADARRALRKNVTVLVGKKDGMIVVEVEDRDPKRAADIANEHVEELRRLTSRLAITEAQQRRVFFEAQLAQTKDRLTQAQQALQVSGFNPGAIKVEPKSAAEAYARLKAEATAAEVRLFALRRSLADDTPEVQQQRASLAALRSQLASLEKSAENSGDADYVTRYRDYKYQETLFDLLAKQYELARVDESREGSMIQVVDPALPPEKRLRPKRTLTAVATTAVAFVVLAALILLRHFWREAASRPPMAAKVTRLRAAMRRR